jgi:hypothetical protein
MTYVVPDDVLIRNPGLAPSILTPTTFQGRSSLGDRPVHGPCATSSTVMVRRPIRFVNQLESATSSSAFTFRASRGVSSRKACDTGRKTMLFAPSQYRGTKDSFGFGLNGWRSSSLVTGGAAEK